MRLSVLGGFVSRFSYSEKKGNFLFSSPPPLLSTVLESIRESVTNFEFIHCVTPNKAIVALFWSTWGPVDLFVVSWILFICTCDWHTWLIDNPFYLSLSLSNWLTSHVLRSGLRLRLRKHETRDTC